MACSWDLLPTSVHRHRFPSALQSGRSAIQPESTWSVDGTVGRMVSRKLRAMRASEDSGRKRVQLGKIRDGGAVVC